MNSRGRMKASRRFIERSALALDEVVELIAGSRNDRPAFPNNYGAQRPNQTHNRPGNGTSEAINPSDDRKRRVN